MAIRLRLVPVEFFFLRGHRGLRFGLELLAHLGDAGHDFLGRRTGRHGTLPIEIGALFF